MSPPSRISRIEDLADDLIELYLAQAADLREYAKTAAAGEDLYRQFEQAAFPVFPAPDLGDQT